ncbi:MAG: VanZ family protein, partial [Patescibacteria group bacterium]
SEYFVLTYLFFRALKNYQFSTKVAIASSAFASVVYALTDELHQSIVAGRQGSIRDILIDTFGILIAIIFLLYYNKNK